MTVAASEAGPDASRQTGAEPPNAPEALDGERGPPSVNQVRSVQAHITRIMTLGLLGVILTGFAVWYVREARGASTRAAKAATASVKAKAAAEMTVPPLGPITPPKLRPVTEETSTDEESVESDERDPGEEVNANGALRTLLGDRPTPPHWTDYAPAEPASTRGGALPAALPSTNSVPSVSEDRRLLGAVFTAQSTTASAGLAGMPASTEREALDPSIADARAADAGGPEPSSGASSLWSSATVRAQRLPTRRGWLAKGTFLDGTLETAIDSTLPGLVTAVLARDTYGADGELVLLERGTRLLGEVRGQVTRGQSRLFVEWQEARTPSGLVVELKSPGTDALGRAGLTGDIDRHFGERFGAALLVSVLDGAVQAGVASSRQGGGDQVVVSPSGSQDIASEALKDTIGIPTTIRVAPGTRLQVLVARDVDFRGVYGSERRVGR